MAPPTGSQKAPVPFSLAGKALPPFKAGSVSIEALHKWMKKDLLDLNADYQRDVVWNAQKQQMLVDSIFLRYHIPPLIFATITNEEGETRRVCIDGKQRLTSIRRFMNGEICQLNPAEPRDKWWYKSTDKEQPGYILPNPYRNQFKNAQMTYVEFEGLDDQQQREVFRRVQLGVALNVSEKMKAETLNDKMEVVKRLSDQHRGTLKESHFNPAREADFRWISTAMFTIHEKLKHRITGANLYATYKAVQKWLGDPSPPVSNHFLDDFEESVTLLIELLNKEPWCIPMDKRPKTLAPTDLVSMIHLVFFFRTRFSLRHLGFAVKAMRESARADLTDLRFNPSCLQAYVDFLDEFKIQGTALLNLPEEDDEADQLNADEDEDEDDEEDEDTSEPEITVLEKGPALSQKRAPASSGSTSSQRAAPRPAPASSQRPASTSSHRPAPASSQRPVSTSSQRPVSSQASASVSRPQIKTQPRPSSTSVTSQFRRMEVSQSPTRPTQPTSSRPVATQPARSLSQYINHDNYGGSQMSIGSKRPGPNIQYGAPHKRPRGG
ncbi:unnamed protein product [Peniophora sp. CBMAI 1063]|nr:unnamed protein product [Peniophora sp. CBMAI 1063]